MKKGISAIVPTYNRAKFLERCIKSICQQTTPVDEIIIIDDGSTDNTKEVVEKFQNEYSNIKYFFQKNQGEPIARNKGLEYAQYNIVAFLDSDDTWTPCHIEESMKSFELCKESGFVIAKFEVQDDANVFTDDHLEQKYKKRDFVKYHPELIDLKLKENFYKLNPSAMLHHIFLQNIAFSTCTLVLNRNRLPRTFYFDGVIPLMVDVDFVSQLLFAGVSPVYIDSLHSQYYMHGNNLVMVGEKNPEKRIQKFKLVCMCLLKRLVYCRNYEEYLCVLNELSENYWLLAIEYNEISEYAQAHHFFKRSFHAKKRFVILKHILVFLLFGEKGKAFLMRVKSLIKT